MSIILNQKMLCLFALTTTFFVGCQTNSPISLKEKLEKRNILWKIVSEKCGTEKDTKQDCLITNKDEGFVVFRDRHGPVQTLIMPTIKITGIEDSQLLQGNARNYFYDAWQSRSILDEQNNKPIDSKYLSFSVNSSHGRSQDQLHIHASCLRKDVYDIVERHRSEFRNQWTKLPEKLLGHTYIAQKVKLADLEKTSPFMMLHAHGGKMGDYGLAVVSVQNDEAILLASKAKLLEGNEGSVEEIQDTHCTVNNF